MSAVEDKLAIYDLYAEYVARTDACDWRGVAELFTADGVFEGRIGHALGRQAIGNMLVEMNPTATSGPKRRHICANPQIKLDGDQAAVRASYLVFMDRGDGPLPIIFGTYIDKLTRDQGVWKFAHHMLVHDIASADIGLNKPLPG
ncbi:MAG: nuclear transport factor 2 family protein [Propionibacteriaceae bacterium]|jgi:uncharacterized protein (TIGR02246 family)|nr:nuclear transport factor 2 family protein [Propionibacteriaceae bacterium]